MKVWVEIAEERLAANYRAVVEAAGAENEVLAVVKANAYGHGAEVCSAVLVRAGTRWLGVTCVGEGMRVRQSLNAAGLRAEILVMCGIEPEDVKLLVEQRLTPVVWTVEQVAWLRGSGVGVHVEVDTGMARQGVRPGAQFEALLDALEGAGVALDGLMTHFASAEVAGSAMTQRQELRFEEAVGQMRARGVRPHWVNAGNSSSVDNPAQETPWLAELAKTVGARAMVRSGLALYGYCLPIVSPEGEGSAVPRVQPVLRPVMTWKTRVLDVRELAAGETVGYGATFTARAPMRVALLPVGYADGLRLELSATNALPGGWVMMRGARAAIVGRVSMNLTVVDVTGIDRVEVGDEVVLLGDGVTAEDHARLAGTIAYEILCAMRVR